MFHVDRIRIGFYPEIIQLPSNKLATVLKSEHEKFRHILRLSVALSGPSQISRLVSDLFSSKWGLEINTLFDTSINFCII